MAKAGAAAYKTFDQITGRLDEIIAAVRDKGTSLERSLDLFDDAIALGSAAVELVDTTDFTPSEEERLAELTAAEEARVADGAVTQDDEGASGEDIDRQPDDAPVG